MSTQHQNEIDVEGTLRRAAEYLNNRGSEYLEYPLQVSVSTPSVRPRFRRVLIGSIAAAVLSVTALAGSFIGNSSSGNVEVALAAWSAEPSTVTDSMKKDFANSCNSIVAEFWRAGGSKKLNETPAPESLKKPSLIDFRGTTKLGVYFGGDLILVCLLFEGGAVMVQRLDGFGGAPIAGRDGSVNAITLIADDRTIGLIFGDLPKDTEPVQSVKIDQVGQEEIIEASVVSAVGRYAAWSPSVDAVSVRFVSQTSEETLGPKTFLPPCLGSCFGAATTIPGEVNQ